MALQGTYGGGSFDAFVAKIKGDESLLIYSKYLGGSGADDTLGIAIDSIGNAYVTEYTTGNFPIQNAFQPTYGGDSYDAFVTAINAAGNS